MSRLKNIQRIWRIQKIKQKKNHKERRKENQRMHDTQFIYNINKRTLLPLIFHSSTFLSTFIPHLRMDISLSVIRLHPILISGPKNHIFIFYKMHHFINSCIPLLIISIFYRFYRYDRTRSYRIYLFQDLNINRKIRILFA